MKIDEFITNTGFLSRTLRQQLTELREHISEISFDAESMFPYELTVRDSSGTIQDILIRAEVVVAHSELAAELRHNDLVLQATTPLTDLETHLRKLQEALTSAIDQIAPFIDESITVSSVEEGLALVTSEGERLELRALFSRIDAILDAAFLAANRIPILADKKVALASNAAAELAQSRARYDAAYAELRTSRSVVRRFATEASAAIEQIESAQSRANDSVDEIDRILNSARAYGEYTPELDEIRKQYTSLKDDINSFEPKLEAFRATVKESENRFEAYSQNIQKSEIRAADFLSENEDLIEKSKEALHWSTAAGLSSSFSSSQQRLNWPIRLALAQFYMAIAFFALSVLIATNSLPFVSDFVNLPSFPTDLDANNWAYIGRILSVATLKFLIVAPALVFLSFSLKTLNTLNRLRHEYGFKQTLSIAVPGFKEEAPNNEEMIVAAAFGELMSNPTEAAHGAGRARQTKLQDGWRTRIMNRAFKLAEEATSSKPTD